MAARIRQLEEIIKEKDKTISDLTLELKVEKELCATLSREQNAERLRILRARLRRQFEASTEQLLLFDEAETTTVLGAVTETPEDAPVVVPSYCRKKARSSVELPAGTPVVDVYDDSAIESCPRCGSPMKETGEKVYETVSRIKRTVVVRRHVKQFSCTQCVPEDKKDGRITETATTGNILDGTVCDPTLFAQIVENKYGYALPLYRQALDFKDIGLSRFTMCSWLMKVGTRLEENMAPCLEKKVFSYPLVNADETPLKVIRLLDEDGKKKAPHSRTNAFMIVRSAVDSKGRPGPVLFSYSDNRRKQTIADLFEGYTGVVQTDGLSGYEYADKCGGFTHIGCLVHARRKAVEAAGGGRWKGLAQNLLKLYGSFFHNEGILKDKYDDGKFSSDDEYITERRNVLKPLLMDIHDYCKANVDRVPPKTEIHTAFNYPLSRWDSLMKFLDFSYATSNNQRAENAIRPFTVGRNNWKFVITECGASVSAFYYSLVESCKAMGINVQDYLVHLLLHSNGIKDGDEAAWTALLPGNVSGKDLEAAVAYRTALLAAEPDTGRTEPYRLRGKRV